MWRRRKIDLRFEFNVFKHSLLWCELSTNLDGMSLQCWVGVKKCEFWLHSRFPMSPLNGRKKLPTWGADRDSWKQVAWVQRQSIAEFAFVSRVGPASSALKSLSTPPPLSLAHFLYLFKNFLSPLSLLFSRVRVVESKLISRFASLSQNEQTPSMDTAFPTMSNRGCKESNFENT